MKHRRIFHVEFRRGIDGESTQMCPFGTHILPNSAPCMGPIFADKPNLIVESRVFPSLHVKCHHQIVYSKLNLTH